MPAAAVVAHVGGKPSARFGADGPPANVELAGYLPHGEVASFLAACDVLLAPYQRQVSIASGFDTARWMSPLKIFEYMAAGRLVLCSDLPALREVDPKAAPNPGARHTLSGVPASISAGLLL